ncbi:Spectrin repeat superfamily Extracellular matrix-binding protein, putative [Babesia ovata]|uniref:Spectrin repeat superfamily Extracellular matrix-binding protein, putative n=1 Tax=Babesia ovata TaxID=189622 RepID=A0A2H6KAE8_9APIC|nr:Spectrin repeat superfamily Extracellular matrix-binding protein, putative [Babesia ovata]GBE59966.1 Spectrin repeat superfamily Extracellular matrix-binding protein, putative [Babesia ovata]
MSFLHGVLQSVKDDDNVTKYNEYIDTPKINNVIRILNDNVGKGRQAFVTAVSQVEERTGEVKDKLGKLIIKLSSGAGEYVQEVKNRGGESLEKQLKKWKTTIQRIEQEVTDIEKQQINVLDNSLSTRIMHEFSPVKKVVDHLGAVAKNTAFGDDVKAVDTEFKQQEEHVIDQIRGKCQSLQLTLTTKFGLIDEGIRAIEKTQKVDLASLIDLVGRLVISVGKADTAAGTLVRDYQTQIVDEIGKIDTQVQGLDTTGIANDLYNVFTDINTHLGTLERQLAEIKSSHEEVQKTVGSKLVGIESELESKITTHKEEIKSKIKDYIMQYIGLIMKSVGGIRDKIGDTTTRSGINYESAYYNWGKLREEIEKLAGDINGDGNGKTPAKPNYEGLKGIKEKVANYAKKFKDEFETKILDGWIARILANDGVVNGRIERYVKKDKAQLKGDFEVDEFSRNAINKAIKDKLRSSIIERNGELFSVTSKDNILQNIDTVIKGITTFVSGLDAELKRESGQTDAFAKVIADKIEADPEWKLKQSPSPYTRYLASAVRYILMTLVITARQTANALQSFTSAKEKGYPHDITYHLGINLETAIANVDNIKTKVGDEAGNGVAPGSKITKALKDVDLQIKSLDSSLGTATSSNETVSGEVKLEDSVTKRVNTNVDAVTFTSLNPLLTQAAEKGVKMLDEKVSGILGGQLGNVKGNIENQINRIKRQPNGDIYQAVEDLKGLIEAVKSSITDIKGKAGNNIRGQVNSLKVNVADLKQGIENFSEQINLFDKALQKVIEEAQSTVDDARETLQRQINETQTALTEAAEQAFKEVYTKAKSTFAEGHMADLEALHKLVTDQKTQIQQIIDKDKRNGAKGFFDKLLRTVLDHEKDLISKSKVTAEEHKFVKEIKEFLHVFFTSVYIQNDFVEFESSFNPIVESTHDMLQQLEESKRFDHTFIKNLDNLNLALHNFEPKKFSEPCSILLDALKDGLNALATQLGYAYVSSYDGAPPIASWEYRDRKSKKTLPTEEAKMCAKVFLTCLPTCFNDLSKLRKYCKHNGDWTTYNINFSNELGGFFDKAGYRVSKFGDSHEGELKNAGLEGWNIYDKLIADISGEDNTKYYLVNNGEENENVKENNKSLLKQLVDHLHSYYAVTQLRHIDGAKPPCNIFQMLCWVTGLWYSPVRRSLCTYFNELFGKPKGMEDRSYKDIDPRLLKLVGTSTIRPRDLTESLHSTCSYAENVLVAILGTGHADGIYACQFSTNDLNLLYPTNMTTLICLLMNVVKRLHSQLHFLYTMCSYETELSGWRDCTYGRYVGASGWQCNTLTYAEQTCDQQCDQRANQNTNQTANQSCNQHPKCGIKSPLQSFLEDGLPGFLPHNVTANGSGLSCTNCPKTSGQPCQTPMGFGDISITASRRHTGQFIFDVIGEFCGGASSHLSNLCNLLNVLLPAAPKTLGEMFAFYYNFVAIWHANGSSHMNHKDTAFNNAVVQANFGNPNTELNITPLFMSTDHGTMQDLPHPNGDLYSLVKCKGASTTTAVHPCGPYLRPLCVDICSIFSDKHVNKYLSWVVYVTETFYDLLKKLYDDCCKTCGGDKPKCRKAPCSQKCNVGRKPTNSSHSDSCISIVNCQTTMPTLCRYGFTFGYSSDLAGKCTWRFDQYNDSEFPPKNQMAIYANVVSPLVAVAPVPAAHRRRPPRRPEDTLPPEITLKPQDRRPVAPRSGARQLTRQHQVLLTIIVPSRVICISPNHSLTQPHTQPHTHPPTHPTTHPLTQPPTHSTTHSLNHPLTHLTTHLITQPLTHSHTHPLTHPLTHSTTHPLTLSLTQPPTHSTTHPPTQPPTHSTTHSPTQPPTHPLNHSPTHSPNHSTTHPPTQLLTHSLNHPLNHLITHSTTQPLTHSPTYSLTHSLTHPTTQPPTQPPNHPLNHSPTHSTTQPLTHPHTHSLTHSTTHPLTHSTTHSPPPSLVASLPPSPSLPSPPPSAQIALDDIDARRISLGQLAGQLSGFIGGSGEIQKALLNGLHSNVNQLIGLLKTSCGGEGCCNIKDFSDEHLKNLQDTFKQYDEIVTKIDSLQKQKDEKNKASLRTPSDGQSEIKELNAKLQRVKSEIFQLSSTLQKEITTVISAVQRKIDDLQKKKKDVDNLQSEVNELKKKIDAKPKNVESLKKELEKHEKDLKDAQNDFPEKDAKSLDSHQKSMRSLNSLERLCQHCDDFESNKSKTPKDILESLCGGLEKFLGYHDGNYTGEGIVYSDLDRLCDGVMSFLHGVLESVKDDESVKKYDGYIKLNNNEHLHTVLQHLQSSIGQGRSVFGERVEEVSEWLKKYWMQVNDKTGEVKTKLGELIKRLSSGAGKYYKEVEKQEGKELQVQLREWQSTIGKIQYNVDTIDNHVSNIDPNLRDKLRNEMNAIGGAVRTLNECADETVSAGQAAHVEEQLKKQRMRIENAIEAQTERVKSTVTHEINKIFEHLGSLGDNNRAHLGKIREAIAMAKGTVESEFGDYSNSFKDKVIECFIGIRRQLDNYINDANSTTLQKSFQAVKTEVGLLEGNVRNGLQALRERISGLVDKVTDQVGAYDNIVGKQLEDLAQAKKSLEKITSSRSQTNSAAAGNLEALFKKAIVDKLSSLVEAVYNAIGDLYDSVTGTTGAVKQTKTIKHIIMHIKDKVEGIEGKTYGLEDIKKTVTQHAEGFKEKKFEKKVEEWVEHILKENKTVSSGISYYVKDNQARNYYKKSLGAATLIPKVEQAIKSVIKTKLSGEIEGAGRIVKYGIAKAEKSNEIIKEYVDAVKKACDSFAEKLREQIEQNGITASNVADVIKQDSSVLDSHLNGRHDASSLAPAVRSTLLQLLVVATKAGNQFAWLADKVDLAKKVDDVSGKVDDLFRKLYYATSPAVRTADQKESPAQTLNTSILAIKQNVDHLENIFTQQVAKDLAKEVDNFNHAAKVEILLAAKTAMTHSVNQLGPGGSIEIKTIMPPFEAGREALVNAVKQIEEELKNLKELPEDVATQKSGAETEMEKLKRDLLDRIGNIEINANTAGRDIGNAILDAENSVRSAYQNLTQAISHLINELTQIVKTAFEKLTSETRLLFTNQKLADLSALHKLVERQAKKIKDIIDKDLANGIKGFLTKIRMWLPDNPKQFVSNNLTDVKSVSDDLKVLLDTLLSYTTEQVKTPSKAKKGEKEDSEESKKVAEIQKAVDKLLSHLSKSDKLYNFDYEFQLKLSALTDAVNALSAEKFAGHQNPELLDALKKGMLGVTGELKHAYVNRYDSQKFTENLVDAKYELTPSNNTTIITLRDYGRKCSKVCATVLFILFRDMRNLRKRCPEKWTSNTIYSNTGLGTFLKNSGYRVSNENDGHDGELRNKSKLKGEHIYDLMTKQHGQSSQTYRIVDDYDDYVDQTSVQNYSVLKRLYNNLECYNEVCHHYIPEKPKSPSNIYQMLQWCSGLQYNYMFEKVCDYLMELFGKPDGYKDSKYSDIPSALLKLDAHPETITYSSLITLLKKVCQNARKPLIAVLGYGHADGVYAVDHFNNSSNLSYPSSAAVCFDMLLDILQRLYQQLYFVLTQCLRGKSTSGWRDCHYGRHVVTNHRGIPCKTPMGFGEISTMASQTQKGERLMRVLRDLCGDSEKPLSKLCGYLVCLTHRAPQNLGDMFAFYQGFIMDYTGGFYGNKESPVHTQRALKDAVTEAYFGQEHPFDPSPLYGSIGHVDSDIKGDLYSISTCTSDSVNSCGLFVQPLTLNIYRIFSSKHKSNYLSWIVYLTETFYDLLKKLFDECDAKCGAKGSNCHNKCCVKKCPVSSKTSTPCNHDSECRSIVKCQNTLPTLYRHGFTYGNAESLNGEYGAGKKRTCKDFCKALKNVLNEDKNVEAPLAKLIYVTIPDFLWKIREPFSLTLLALWSLSLLYLLHIAVVRLDVLRIRSHLRSPSSHRIAAQSLLAAARVKALGNVKYFHHDRAFTCDLCITHSTTHLITQPLTHSPNH